MTVQQKSLSLAVLAAVAGFATTAQAAIPGTDGTGAYLQFPYYTVNGGNDTLMSVVNSTSSVKAIKVRFFDGKNTKEVLDFNLFLSAYDVWTASLSKNAAGGVTLKTNDKSCTVPTIGASGVDFRNSLFTERDQDGNFIDRSIARTTEGHFEVIEMGVIDPASTVGKGVTHSAGVPADCSKATAMYTNSTTLSAAAAGVVTTPTGGLFGSGTVVNVGAGTSIGYDPDALNTVYGSAQHFAPGNTAPNLGAATPVSSFFSNGTVYSSAYANGNDAVSAIYMRSAVMAEWIVEPALNAGTDIILTFPTKYAYTFSCGTTATPPFTNKGFCATGAPEAIGLSIYDQEERTNSSPLDFSPLPPAGTTSLPWETNVVTINNTKVLGSSLSQNVTAPAGIGSAGWIKIDLVNGALAPARALSGTAASATANGVACGTLTQRGLPVQGFSVNKFANGNVGGVLSNYGNNYGLKYERMPSCL
jgi:hypothetical protein